MSVDPGSIDGGMVIVGAGKAGARAAVALREEKWDGPITLIGSETLPPYDRPPLSKSAITDEAAPSPVELLDVATMAALRVTPIFGVAATGIDRASATVLLADGRRVSYHRLLLALGANPRPLNCIGGGRSRLLRLFGDAILLRSQFVEGANVVIVGGGFIGLELAASGVARGAKVTVLEAQPRILMRAVPPEIAAVVDTRHRDAGVNLRVGVGIAERTETGVICTDGTTIAADIVVAGIGAVPAIRLAEASGLAIDNGIACDSRLATSDPGIFAAGDCCSFPHPLYGDRRIRLEAWRAAQDQAQIAAANMLGGSRVYDAVPWFWSDQYDLTLQIAGLPGEAVTSVARQLPEPSKLLFHLAADGRLVAASGIGKGNAIARDIRLAEMLIGKRAVIPAEQLADPGVGLKALMKA